MNFQYHSTQQQDVQKDLDKLQDFLLVKGIDDDADGRKEAVSLMFSGPFPLDANTWFDHFKHMVVHYDPSKAAEIDAWIQAVVAGHHGAAGMLFYACQSESFNAHGRKAFLRVGIDLTRPVEGLDLRVSDDRDSTEMLVDASLLAALLAHFDAEDWLELDKEGFFPKFDVAPYAGRVFSEDGSETILNFVDYLLALCPDAMDHLFALDRLNRESPAVRTALADGAIRMIKQWNRCCEKFTDEATAPVTTKTNKDVNLTRAALLIGAGADIMHVAAGIRNEPRRSLPSLLASANKHEYTPYIVRGAEQIARIIKSGSIADELRPVFDIQALNEGKISPLHLAAANGYPDVVSAYIAAGADVNARDEDLRTPLHKAVLCGLPRTLEILLQAGADVNAQTLHGYTPETMAHNVGRHQLAQMIAAERARRAIAGVLDQNKHDMERP
jgi:hypothetical protein